MSLWIAEVIISVAMIITGIIFWIGTLSFGPSTNPMDIGTAAFPRISIAALILFALAQIALSYFRNKKAETHEKLDFKHWPTALMGLAILIAYLILMPAFGYYIITPIFIFALMFMQGNRKWLQMIMVTGGFCLFVYLVFNQLLRVMLP